MSRPSEEDRARVGEALRASFARLSPQGTDEWNFMGAFTHLGDRYGPYQPGASDLADLLRSTDGGGRRTGRRHRLTRAGQASVSDDEKSEVEDAMTHVVEAFRFLHARVSTLEARIRTEDVPLDGAAWLAPARELGALVEPLVAFLLSRTPGSEILHADCGEGELLRALAAQGVDAHGVEPRGGVALRALESGCSVAICEATEHLSRQSTGSLGGLVLSGLVDRLPLHAIIPLLVDCRRALSADAPMLVVSEPVIAGVHDASATHEIVDGAVLHAETWALLLDRSGFTDIAPLSTGGGTDERLSISAMTPAT